MDAKPSIGRWLVPLATALLAGAGVIVPALAATAWPQSWRVNRSDGDAVVFVEALTVAATVLTFLASAIVLPRAVTTESFGCVVFVVASGTALTLGDTLHDALLGVHLETWRWLAPVLLNVTAIGLMWWLRVICKTPVR
jgi:hypothetical protein